MRARLVLVVLGLVTSIEPVAAATWQLSAGPTDSNGSALEIARSTPRWEAALGFVSAQQVDIRTEQDLCIATATGPDCVTLKGTNERGVDNYGYVSVQRRFALRPYAQLQPVFGLGVVANSDTNPYVSSAVAFSVSTGLRLGPRWTLEWRHFSNAGLAQPNLGQDILLLRGRFGR
ncbi:MAG: acyloxyacyl hydrolase [Gammaproteobacteria bacterium]|nr:acyloxyacyl hydrolase [Gammaproteobacteria bacterium]